MQQNARKLIRRRLLILLTLVCVVGAVLIFFKGVPLYTYKVMIHTTPITQWNGVVVSQGYQGSSQSTPSPVGTVQSTPPIVEKPQATPLPGQPPLSISPSAGSSSQFTLQPPGSQLTGDSACAMHVHMSSFDPRPDNSAANHRVPTSTQIMNLDAWTPDIGMDIRSDSLRTRITGNFTGTTDEILQWVACKWGIDADIVRAEAVTESTWHQRQVGDYTTNRSLCPAGTWDGSGCYQSYGILQVKYTDWKHSWPMTRDDTAFNADFAYGWLRNCYEGWADYLYERNASYHAGDFWGCVGFWYSGNWYDSNAVNYINTVKGNYQKKLWLQSDFYYL